jgi:hypothetical protein
MSKKKKKANLQAQQKIQVAQHKKLYMERLRTICTLIGDGEPLFDLLPQFIRDTIYDIRGVMFKIRVEPGAKITKRLVKIMHSHIEKEIKLKWMDLMIPNMNKQVNLMDYCQLVLPLDLVLANFSRTFTGREKFEAFCLHIEERYTQYYNDFLYIIHNACYTYCDLSKWALYTFKFDEHHNPIVVGHKKTYDGIWHQNITLGLYPLDIRYVTIHGDRRPAIQLGKILHNNNVSTFQPITVSSKRLHLNDPSGSHKEIPVYVQQHAFNRTMQRAGCVFPGSALSLIDHAFEEHHKILRESSNRYLVECYSFDIKLGYFAGIYIEGIFVILTFLLITHSGTPEGRKLAELTGLQRQDMTFLAIDDLKTLINSDILSDERIAKIFIEAGCESILKMNFQVSIGNYDWLWDEAKQDTKLSKLIAEYLQLGPADEDYYEND